MCVSTIRRFGKNGDRFVHVVNRVARQFEQADIVEFQFPDTEHPEAR